jgi:Zn-dependent protease with chaperone function
MSTHVTAWWIVPLAVATLLGGLAVAPVVLSATGRTRRLRPAERTRLARGFRAHGPERAVDGRSDGDSDGIGSPPLGSVRVLDTAAPLAFAVGLVPIAGGRQVVVSAGLLDRLPPAEAAAVVRHEEGHLVRHHTLARVGVPSAFALAWGIAVGTGVPGAFPAGLALVPLAAVSAAAVSRWSEYDADAYAAAAGAGPALSDGLDRLDGPDTTDGGRAGRFVPAARLLSRHPPTADRVARLRERSG